MHRIIFSLFCECVNGYFLNLLEFIIFVLFFSVMKFFTLLKSKCNAEYKIVLCTKLDVYDFGMFQLTSKMYRTSKILTLRKTHHSKSFCLTDRISISHWNILPRTP